MSRPGKKIQLTMHRAKQVHLEPELKLMMDRVGEGRFSEVETAARKYLARRPGHPLAMKALGFALIGLQRYRDALPVVIQSLKTNPGDPELLNNLGIVKSELMCWEEAIPLFERAIQLSPQDCDIYMNLGNAYFRKQEWAKAVPPLLKAIELFDGDFVSAIAMLGLTLINSYRYDEALVCLEQLYEADPDDMQILFLNIHASLHSCSWDNFEGKCKRLLNDATTSSRLDDNPFMALSVPGTTGSLIRRIAEAYSVRWLHQISEPLKLQVRDIEKRIKVGYLSGDFRRHPVGMLLREFIERHDRGKFEWYAFSIGPDDDSEVRKQIADSVDHFVDLKDCGIAETVRRIRETGVDILVDLHGWTALGRPEALAQRCAPVQVNWLGYAGTMGSPMLADYIIADPVALPLEYASDFSEKIVHLPHCYLPVESRVEIPAPPPRCDEGLPESGFVFCSFNASYKFNPGLFEVWCRLLRENPGSVLWLRKPESAAVANLRKEAAKRGIPAERLVFAERIDSQEHHLARLRLADLALDTGPYNSHSTGMEMLLAGIPMVTCIGNLFQARVGASLLYAAGLTELVASSEEDYFSKANRVCKDPNYLAQLKHRLATARATAPLFDMAGFSRDLEAVYLRIWKDREGTGASGAAAAAKT